jgi:hypothetical protein
MDTGLHEVPERVDSDVGIPLSQRIRQRLRSAGVRFHANDNIADYLREGEIDGLQAEVAEQLQHMLRSLVIDVDADHNTRDTAKRLARMFMREVFSGRDEPAPAVTEFPDVERLDELMIVGPLRIRSAFASPLSNYGPCVDRGDAQRMLEPDRSFEIWTVGQLGHEPTADSGGGDQTGRGPAREPDRAGRPCGGSGSRSFLHALARHKGRWCKDDQ